MTRSLLTKQQRDHLLKLWAEEGTAAAYAVASKYGVTKSYVQKMASFNKVKAKVEPAKAKGGKPPKLSRVFTVVSHYWQSTKSPVHLFPREYESEEVAKYISENSFVDATLLSNDLRVSHLHPQAVRAYQRRLGVRKIATNKRDAA